MFRLVYFYAQKHGLLLSRDLKVCSRMIKCTCPNLVPSPKMNANSRRDAIMCHLGISAVTGVSAPASGASKPDFGNTLEIFRKERKYLKGNKNDS